MIDGQIQHEGSRNLGPVATVFQGEAIAITEALSWIDDQKLWGYDIAIHTDSMAVMGAVKNSLCLSQTIKTLKTSLNKLTLSNNISLNWVRGHANTTGNEFADHLAKKGTKAIVNQRAQQVPVA